MTPAQRSLVAMNRAIYAAAQILSDENHPEATTLRRLALASDEIVQRNLAAKP
jgi:hypothetical protein